MVREYLRSLPVGVKSQSYCVQRSDGSAVRTQVGAVTLAELPTDAPALDEVVASVMGVSFDPARPEVRLQDPKTKRTVVCSATAPLVEQAVSLRSTPVRALMVQAAGKLRLLRLRSADVSMEQSHQTADTRGALLWERWDELLRRFAQ